MSFRDPGSGSARARAGEMYGTARGRCRIPRRAVEDTGTSGNQLSDDSDPGRWTSRGEGVDEEELPRCAGSVVAARTDAWPVKWCG